MTPRQLATAALALDYTRKSFATLDRHHARGPIDMAGALRLLARNIRDVPEASHASPSTRAAAARLLLDHWLNRHARHDRPGAT